MKPRVYLEAETFLNLIAKENRLVIRTKKMLFRGHMYITEADSYYFVAFSKEPIDLPGGTKIIDAKIVGF